MLFSTLEFVLFFAAVLAVHRVLPPGRRNGFLLGASLLFYTLWIPAYALLLVADIVVNYALLRAMARSAHPRRYLIASITFTLGLLAYFKYAAFLVESALPMLAWIGWQPPLPHVFLPLGISFYSFQIVALAVDSYRGRSEAVDGLRRYALFVCFFPQLVAGPILRGPDLLPQLARGAEISRERTRRGIWLVASGLTKKLVLADFLLAQVVDPVFDSPGAGGTPFHVVALYSFAFQLYFDFSGYTDMARGLACLLGFELPMNFTEPFLARNPSEFWRRWHITLTSWLRDYLFIPLSRSLLRRSGGRWDGASLDAAQMATMLLCGLWHGAGWTFVAWGGLCGAMLVLHRHFGARGRSDDEPVTWSAAPRILAHFTVFSATLVLFRSPTFGDALDFARGLVGGGELGGWPLASSATLALCAALHVAERVLRPRLPAIRAMLDRPGGAALEATALGAIAGLALTVAGAGGEFIYFQF